MNIVVTGGAGYIGSHIVNRLIQLNHRVLVYDNLSSGFKSAVHACAALIVGDVRDYNNMKSAFEEFRPDLVIHTAAKLSVSESMAEPDEYYDVNTKGTLQLLKVCGDLKVKKIIYSSTGIVYGNSEDSGFYNEESPLNPLNPYAKTKIEAEKILLAADEKKEIELLILRYFNVAGASLDGGNGQRANGSQLIKTLTKAACSADKIIEIYGQDYPTPDGTCIRDYIHVEDLAELHLEAINYLFSETKSKIKIVNCGYGKGHSVKEIIRAMELATGVEFKLNYVEKRKGDAAATVANTEKLNFLFPHWQPRCNDINIICKTAYVWEQAIS